MQPLESWYTVEEFMSWAFRAHEAIEVIEDTVSHVLGWLRENGQVVHPSAVIHPSAVLDANVAIGPNARIGPTCYIREWSIIDADVYLGYDVEVSRAIIMAGTQVHHSACIDNAIIGRDCNLGAGFIIATRRLGKETAGEVHVGEHVLKSKRRHHGVVIGHQVETGVMVCTMPGASIGHKSLIFPTSVVSGCLLPDSQGYYAPAWIRP